MFKTKNIRAFAELNFALIFMATSGPLGSYIAMTPALTIAFRSVFGALLIFLFCRLRGFSLKIKTTDRKIILLSGLLTGIHWITYFYALRYSNVSIGMLVMLTFPVITSLLEPLILKTKFHSIHVVLGLWVLVGVYFLVPEFDIQNSYTQALGFGFVSATTYSLRNIIIKSRIKSYQGSVIMFYQLAVIGVCLSPLFFLLDTSGFSQQLTAHILLILLPTAIGHTWYTYSFRNFSTTTVSILSCVQPIYGIIIGIIVLHDYPDGRAIIGGAIILSSVIIESLRKR